MINIRLNEILIRLMKNEAATLTLAKSLMTEEEFDKYYDMYTDHFNSMLDEMSGIKLDLDSGMVWVKG